jgi:UDPglucose 6-dehydrogenase
VGRLKLGQNLAVVGSGYVGTVVAACFASLGYSVVAVEADERKLRSLRRARAPFYEPGLDDLLSRGLDSGRLSFSHDFRFALADSDVVFLCVGTPPAADGRPDTEPLVTATRQIAGALQRHQVLVTKSTVPIGSGKWLASIVEESLPDRLRKTKAFPVVANPEFLREATAISDFLHPDRIVLGSDDAEAMEIVAELYRPILDQSFDGGEPQDRPALMRTTLVTAETVKYAANAFLATKVSFINEIARICELAGADVVEVADALGLDHRIGAHFLKAGAGWGGSCLGKDVDALTASARDLGYTPELLEAVVAVNKRQRELLVRKLQQHLKTLRGRRIGLLGLAFKAGTDDLRNAPAVDVAKMLIKQGAFVTAHDPVVEQVPELPDLRVTATAYEAAERADALVVMTDWPEFVGLDLAKLKEKMRGELLIDGRNLLDPAHVAAAGLRYDGIGRAVGHTARSRTESAS